MNVNIKYSRLNILFNPFQPNFSLIVTFLNYQGFVFISFLKLFKSFQHRDLSIQFFPLKNDLRNLEFINLQTYLIKNFKRYYFLILTDFFRIVCVDYSSIWRTWKRRSKIFTIYSLSFLLNHGIMVKFNDWKNLFFVLIFLND